jgi:hypothetical protein
MTVGQPASETGINGTLTTLALQLRELADDILEQWAYLNKLGTGGLQNLGFSPADAQAALDAVDHMQTVAAVYKGTATQGTAFNFEDALTILWAGQ